MAISKTLRIGVFLPAEVQLLDLSPIDLFGMLDPKYLTACKLPAPIIALGVPSRIHYISVPETGSHVELTASAVVRLSHTTTDAEVQPGMLDIILVPGPNPSTIFKENVLDFLKGHGAWKGSNGERTDILSVCTGCILLGQSGLLKGKRASGPRMLVDGLRKDFPETSWVDDKRWVKDGNIWSSGNVSCLVALLLKFAKQAEISEGGITNGQEMVAAYIRDNFSGPAAEVVVSMADVGDKGIDYMNSKSGEKVWWLWLVLKSLVVGNGKSKRV